MSQPDLSAEHTAELHERLRAFLLGVMGTESPATIAAALAYELASLAAMISPTMADADTLLRHTFDATRAQVRAYGVGHPHP